MLLQKVIIYQFIFSAEKPEIKATSVNTATTVTMSQTVQPSSSVTAASSTSVSSLTGSITSVAGSTNEQPVPKSPIQEVGGGIKNTLDMLCKKGAECNLCRLTWTKTCCYL